MPRRRRSSRAPPRRPRARLPSSAMRPRFVCQGSTGSARPSSSAKRRMTSTPESPNAASVPAAPPSWTASRSARTRPGVARRLLNGRRASRRPSARTWSALPAAGASGRPSASTRWASASAAHSSRRRRSLQQTGPALAGRRASPAVSTMSWLVAPWWTYAAASSPTARASARTSGSAGLPPARPSSARRSASKRSARHAAAIASAACAGITPARASACASARSASSIAASQAASEVASRNSAGTNSRSNTQTAKNGVCPVALQPDVELEARRRWRSASPARPRPAR